MRTLNEYLYPIRYQDKFYTDILIQHDWSQYGASGDALRPRTACPLYASPSIRGRFCAWRTRARAFIICTPASSCRAVFTVFLRDVLVGAICCRLEPTDEGFKLYVLTLGVLEAYRRLGLAERMLAHIIAKAREQPLIKEIYLHVQDGNDAALTFYRKNAFDASEHVPDYYKNLTPTGATLLRKHMV
jgi:ribosomal protein S18 acetylase RimI-like enzyme